MTTAKATKIYQFIKGGHISFDGGHAIHTPQALVEEILSKLPLAGEILVLFNVEFVVSLVYTYGIDPARITFYSDHPGKVKLLNKVAQGTKYLDSLDNNNMKFDVVIGNPPYQDDENVGDKKTAIIPLWFRITKKAFAIAATDGYVAFVTPSSWMSKSNKIHKEITSHDIVHARLFEKTPFPGVGTTVSVWIAQNTPSKSRSITLTLGDDTFIANLDGFIPANSSSCTIKQSILDKTLNSSLPKFDFIIDSRNHSSKTSKISPTKTSTHVWPVLHTYSNTTWSNTKDDLHGVPKLLVSKTGSINKAVVDTDHSIGQNTLALITPNEAVALNAKLVLTSKLYKFASRCPVHSATTSPEVFKALPAVDLTRTWTDAELYAHFNLTQEEIDLIEATVK